MTYTTTSCVFNTYQPQPEGYLTVGKNRIKQFGETVYMNDGQEFEFELFNSKQAPVLIKIKINGAYISNTGMYLKPGQRIFLDRFIDVNKKFLFSTYEVDGTSAAVKQAIANNGLVEIEFYDEYIKTQPVPILYWDTTWNDIISNQKFGVPNPKFDITCTAYNSTVIGNSSTFTNSSTLDSLNLPKSKEPKSFLRSRKSIETGRVEAGGKSDQKFTQINADFNNYYTNKITWKILPNSQKPVEVKDLINYCPSCGSKIKNSSFKFCPNCGNKIN